MTTIENDIQELEGPFEQIAGAAPTEGSDSSGSETITLTIEEPVVDYGNIEIGKITNKDAIKDLFDQGKSLIDQLKNISISVGPITPSVGEQITQISNQFQTLTSSVATMKAELSKAKGQTTPAPRELKIQSSKGYYSFEIVVESPIDVHRKPGNTTDDLGKLSATSGKTDGEGKATIIFTPNVNYGKTKFKVKHGSIESDLVPFENKGQFKEDAQKELQDELDKLDEILAVAGSFIPIIGGIVGVLVAKQGVVVAAMAALFAILVGVYAWMALYEDFRKKKKKLREKTQPKIDELPSKL